MRRRLSPIVIALCTAILGASVGHASGIKGLNALGQKDFNALGLDELQVPELPGLGGLVHATVIGSVGYGARKIYQKIVRRDQE
jgi:hypothetical protein